ncbi:MAG: hypothetical protein WAT66_14610 [Actinomycetota bacterium]
MTYPKTNQTKSGYPFTASSKPKRPGSGSGFEGLPQGQSTTNYPRTSSAKPARKGGGDGMGGLPTTSGKGRLATGYIRAGGGGAGPMTNTSASRVKKIGG